MNGFHIDMNMAQFTRPYLEKWLRELARLGYDTILWEVENNIRWESCPECASPDAFSKEEFKDLLKLCSSLGLESIPLFQTLGHCEYVLKHERYKHLAELPGRIDQYCPRNPELVPFLSRWIEEYLEVFGPVRQFHLGGDEAWSLGSCGACRAFVQTASLSQLYIDHINAISVPLLARNIQPAIWADMVLHHPEALERLSRKIMIYDWMYDIYRDQGKVWVWGKGLVCKEDLPPETLTTFGKFLYPQGDEPGREPETFYTADYLAAHGFDTVTCPGSSSYGDNVFSPRNYYHLKNTFDSFQKGCQPNFKGSMLTSWTVHLFPYELQLACLAIPGYLKTCPRGTLEDYQRDFVRRFFKTDDDTFLKACGLLSKFCVFTHTSSLGFFKSCLPAPADHVQTTLARLGREGKLLTELKNCRARLAEYTEGLELLRQFAARAKEGQDVLAVWDLAARNLIHRARTSEFLIQSHLAAEAGLPMAPAFQNQAKTLLESMQDLRRETAKLYEPILKPARRAEVIEWIFGAVGHALEQGTVPRDAREA